MKKWCSCLSGYCRTTRIKAGKTETLSNDHKYFDNHLKQMKQDIHLLQKQIDQLHEKKKTPTPRRSPTLPDSSKDWILT